MKQKRVIATDLAPLPRGAYSQAVIAGDFVFVAGQGPLDPGTGQLRLSDIRDECKLTLKNIEAILKASGTSLENVVSSTVYLRDLEDLQGMNEVYSGFFPNSPPARATIQAGDLPAGIKIEISVIAMIPGKKQASEHFGCQP